MSRDRYDREGDRYRERRPGRERYEGERYGPQRDDYYGREREYDREEDETLVRRGDRWGYDYGGRERYAEERGGYGGRYDRRDERGDERGEEGRSLFDDLRERFGGRGGRRRGPSRSHVRCRDIMTKDVTVATRETTLEAVARMMKAEDTGVIPVVERASSDLTDLSEKRPDVNRVEPNVAGSGGKLVGLITDRDIVVRALAEGKDARAVRAEEIMTTDIHAARPNDRVLDAVRKMGDKQVRRIPVVDNDGNLRGIISMADVALETEDDRELAEALEEISSGSSFWSKVFG